MKFCTSNFKQKAIVLGFYDRGNYGDEYYKIALSSLLGKALDLYFVCTDDIECVPDETSIVICGGGDIVNPYFMTKIESITKDFKGPIYGVSIGIPYREDTKYLKIFDHIFVRSRMDYQWAIEIMGRHNVTYVPDLSLVVPQNPFIKISLNRSLNIGIALAQPVFAKHEERAFQLIKEIVETFIEAKVILFSFNTFQENPDECDLDLNIKLAKIRKNIKLSSNISNIQQMDVMVCSRYHSVMFAMRYEKPFIPVFSSSKIDKLLQDIEYPDKYKHSPKDDPSKIVQSIKDILSNKLYFQQSVSKEQENDIRELILKKKRRHNSLEKPPFEEVYKSVKNLQDPQTICYMITKQINSKYLWGLKENMKKPDFDLYEATKYIYHHFEVTPMVPFIDPFIRDNYEGVHRSGWQYVKDHMVVTPKTYTFIDTYVDKTFHWGASTLRACNIIPYRQPWVGFIHHTFDESHSSYNCVNLFKSPDFQESLKSCKALIVLSKYLQKQIQDRVRIPVIVLYHPTEFPTTTFCFSKFMTNPNKYLLQIGAWLRDTYAIYELPLYNSINPLKISKAALKGKQMANYYIVDHSQLTHQNTSMCRCEPQCENKYLCGLNNHIRSNHDSVHIIENLSNQEYDKFLSENIVFLKLIDCSASNTIIECIVRNTPFFVNRHPAIEEYVGVKYPGFYNDYGEVVNALQSPKRILKMYKYLCALDKTSLKIETFLKNLPL